MASKTDGNDRAAASPEAEAASNGGDTKLSALRSELGARLTTALVDRLGGRGIHTLSDLRAAGGPREATRHLRGVKMSPRLVDELEAHIRLSILPSTSAANARLVDAGFTNVERIADLPRDEFIAAVGDSVGAENAAAVHDAAGAQSRFLSNLLTGVLANGTKGHTASTARALMDLSPEMCDCDCRDATSPVAYLADLLDYGIKHLRSVVFANGLRGEYFADTSFGTKVLDRIDGTVDFNWGTGSPGSALPADSFSVRWTGEVQPKFTETYTFHLAADDGVRGVRLSVDGQTVVDKSSWSSGGTAGTPAERFGDLYLRAGQRYDVKLEYVESGGGSRLQLLWSSPSQAKQVVPKSAFFAGDQTEPITLSFLEDRYHQPFRGLSEDCEYMEKPIRQARIAAEALRASLPSALAASEITAYVGAVYRLLLEQLGTSYDELRAAAGSNDKAVRQALATKLGILERGGTANDHLNDLFLDAGAPSDMTEDALDLRFGYRSSTRPPLELGRQGAVVEWRLNALRRQWYDEDWPQSPPADARPLIDPDLVGPQDLVDSQPTITFPRAPSRPMDFLEDRQRWLDQKLLDVREAFDSPEAGFESLITDTFVDPAGVTRQLLLGIGTTVAQFEQLSEDRLNGVDVAAGIHAMQLDEEGFDFLADAWRTQKQPGGQLTESDIGWIVWILVQHLKRMMFATWRAEEKAKNITLSPRFFRLRTASDPGSEFPWHPIRFRAAQTDRRAWVEKLRSRIEREQNVVDAMDLAIAAAEEAYIVELRNALLRLWASPGLITREKIAALTDRLQLDMEAGACEMTTRVAQAIETIQGALFGARNGLLEGRDLVLDDEERFDEAWRWIGSYSSWRAAISVFLHPENALRPTLRRERTAAFDDLVDTLRNAGQVTQADAQRAADAYSDYFRDVCALTFAGLAQVSAPPVPGEDPAAAPLVYLLLARGGSSGRLYYCLQDVRPDWWLQGGFRRSLWNAVPGLDATADVEHVVSVLAPSGRSTAAVYVTSGTGATRQSSFVGFDGSNWTAVQAADIPVLLTSARLTGVIPPSPALAAAGAAGWKLETGDRVAMLDVDGDGRKELVLAAQYPDVADGKRRFGIARERAGALVLDKLGHLSAEWDLPPGEPVVLRTTLVQSPSQRREQLLVVKDSVPRGLGLVGATTGSHEPALIATAATGSIPGTAGASAWTIDTQASFVAADVDGDGFSELVAVEPIPSGHRVSILGVRETGFDARSTQDVTGYAGGTWTRMVPAWAGGSAGQALIVKTSLPIIWTFTWNATLKKLDQAATTRVDMLPGAPEPIGFGDTSQSFSTPLTWEVGLKDEGLVPARLGLREGGEELVAMSPYHTGDFPEPDGPDTAVFIALSGTVAQGLKMSWRSGSVIPAEGGFATDWQRKEGDAVVAAADLDGDGHQEIVLLSPDAHDLAVAGRTPTAGLGVQATLSRIVRDAAGKTAGAWRLKAGTRYLAGDLDGDGCEEIVVVADGGLGILRGLPPKGGPAEAGVRTAYGPSGVTAFDIVTAVSPRWARNRPAAIRHAYELNRGLSGLFVDDPDVVYLDEAYHFVPSELALRLRDAGSYTAALDWLRSVYDYERPADERKIAYGLVINGDAELTFVRGPEWLADPLNPHAVAATRKDAHTRFTIISTVRCLLDFADAEFTRATAESLPRARELYLKAIELLDAPELQERGGACADILGRLEIQIGSDEEKWIWHEITRFLGSIASLSDLVVAAGEVEQIMASKGSVSQRLATARAAAEKAANGASHGRDLVAIFESDGAARETAAMALLADEPVARAAEEIGRHNGARPYEHRNERESAAAADTAANGHETIGGGIMLLGGGYWASEWIPAPSPSFCIRPNTVPGALRSHAEINLRKLRSCRSIAGLELHVAPYAEATAETAATGDGLPSPQPRGFQPLPYRYSTLIERTKQLVELARQMEQSMLGAIQSADHAEYEEVKARHDMTLARSEMRLRDLQLVQAADGVRSAELQRDRSTTTVDHYRRLLDAGLTTNEELSVGFLAAAAVLHVASSASSFYGVASAAGVFDFGSAQMASGLSSLAAASSTVSQVMSTYASYERRAQEWTLQRDLGQQDVRIGEQQIRLAQDQTQIVVQERAISSLQLDHAEEILDFLTTRRIGTAELYEWMSGLLEQIYRFFLQQAASMAKLAEAQLAFERQELAAAFIGDDYWTSPGGRTVAAADGTALDRHGLTGSARLLRDVTELDQYAFRTDQRKLQLTKTISLAQLDPFAYQRFRETGVLSFATPQILFDRDFPGHYLRLIKRVRTSVIALIPPTQGIHATLSTTGPSRVVIGHDTFETVVVQRPPESVALTSPTNATGLFELNPQPEILAPFEGTGVDATWNFTLPKAANLFDYSGLMDVLLTIEYTALNSYDYRQQVVKQLDRRIGADRPFLFRHQFADAWYDLHNPEEIDDPAARMVVRFRTARDDFPPNIDGLTMRNVGVYFSRAEGQTSEVEIESLTFRQNGLTVASSPITSSAGIISTRRANAGSLAGVIGLAPDGEWELSFNYGNATKDTAIRKRFKDEQIEDIVFVVSYAGDTPAWPQ